MVCHPFCTYGKLIWIKCSSLLVLSSVEVLLLLDLLLELYLLWDPSMVPRILPLKSNPPYHDFCTLFLFSMRSATTSPLYRLFKYSTHLLTLSLLSVNAIQFHVCVCITSSFSKIFYDYHVSYVYFVCTAYRFHLFTFSFYPVIPRLSETSLYFVSKFLIMRFPLLVSYILVSFSLVHQS